MWSRLSLPVENSTASVRRGFFSILTGILIVSSLWLVLSVLSEQFRLVTIIADGDAELLGEIDRLRGRNLLFFSTKRLQKEILTRNIWLQEVVLEKIFPDTLVIITRNRVPVLQIESDGYYYLVDENGLIFSSSKIEQTLPRLSALFSSLVVGRVLEPEIVNTLFPLLRELHVGGLLVTSIDYHSPGDVRLLLPSGVVIISSTSHFRPAEASSLQMIMRSFRIEGKFPRTIDLRFDKPVVTF